MAVRDRTRAALALGAAAAGLALLAWGGPAGLTGQQIFLDQPLERPVSVAAAAGWVDSGIDVAPGEVLFFRAAGEVILQRGNPEAACGPDGLDLVTVDQPIPDANLGALIGKVAQLVASRPDEDSGQEIRDEVFVLFLIGSERAVAAPFKGRLYLGVNENAHKDNAGEFSVVVIRRPV